MNDKRKPVYLYLLLTILLVCPALFADQENLLKNSGFEETGAGGFQNWQKTEYEKGQSEFRIENSGAHSGSRYLKIINNGKNDTRLIQDVPVEANTLYCFSSWVKADGIDPAWSGANLSLPEYNLNSDSLHSTEGQWQYLELYIRVKKGISHLTVSVSLGGYGNINTGEASFDSLVFRQIHSVPPGHKAVQVSFSAAELKHAGRSASMAPGKIIVLVLYSLFFIGLLIRVVQRIKKENGARECMTALKQWFRSRLVFCSPKGTGVAGFLTSPFFKTLICLLILVCLGGVFFWDLGRSFQQDPIEGDENHFVILANTIMEEGRLDISVPLHDTANKNGKIYVIYPPFPLLLLFPFVALTGLKTQVTLVALLISLASLVLLARIFIKLEVESRYIPWLLLAFFLGTGYWISLRTSLGVAFFAHIASVFAMLLALNETLGRGRALLAGLFLGASFLSRQLMIYFALFIFAALWIKSKEKPLKERLYTGLRFGIGFGSCVVIYLIYNWLRFGNIFDTGYAYLNLGHFLNSRVDRYGLFHIAYIPFNFICMFLQGFHINFGGEMDLMIDESWPLDPFGTAITVASPFIFFALWAKWNRGLSITAWISILACLVHQLMYYNNGWVQYNTQRFSMDFFPLLIILVALGIKHIPPRIWKPLILYSVALNAFTLLLLPAVR